MSRMYFCVIANSLGRMWKYEGEYGRGRVEWNAVKERQTVNEVDGHFER